MRFGREKGEVLGGLFGATTSVTWRDFNNIPCLHSRVVLFEGILGILKPIEI